MEYKKLLVPLDGSKPAETVLPAAIAIALRSSAEITVMHVLEEHAPATIHGEKHLLDPVEAAKYVEGIASELRAAGVAVRTHVHEAREGDVARSIVEHANEFATDLIVMCAHGPGGLRGFVSGRVGQQVLHRGTRPVLLLQAGVGRKPAEFQLRSVVVPLDGTDAHPGSLASAASLAKLFGAGLHLLYVVPTTATLADERGRSAVLLPTAMRAILDMTHEQGTEYLDRIAEACRSEGLDVTSEVLRGSTVDALLKRAGKLDADLIAMSSHGHGGATAFLSGSVTPRLMARIESPLLLVRAPD
jgi:nucleotide-binding universal stress UspA family protein